LVRKFAWSRARAEEAIRAILAFTTLVDPDESVSVVGEDEADNRILECAVAAGAGAIVTGDRHLLRLRRYREISIMGPRDFIRGLTAP
jgi:uncharacterized protein